MTHQILTIDEIDGGREKNESVHFLVHKISILWSEMHENKIEIRRCSTDFILPSKHSRAHFNRVYKREKPFTEINYSTNRRSFFSLDFSIFTVILLYFLRFVRIGPFAIYTKIRLCRSILWYLCTCIWVCMYRRNLNCL